MKNRSRQAEKIGFEPISDLTVGSDITADCCGFGLNSAKAASCAYTVCPQKEYAYLNYICGRKGKEKYYGKL